MIGLENSIECRLSFSDERLAKETIEYLMNTGIGHDKYKGDNINYYKSDDIYITEILRQYFINHPQSIDKYTFLQNFSFTHWVKEKCSKMC